MADITAALVKELRERTGAGMMIVRKRWLKLTATSSCQLKTCVNLARSKLLRKQAT
jgi:translation elongation factor EF-Ts